MKVKIVSPVRHDGEDLEVGKVVDLDEKFAQPLIEFGAAEPAGKAKEKAD